MLLNRKKPHGVYKRFTSISAQNFMQPGEREPYDLPSRLESPVTLFDRLEKFWYYSDRGVSGPKPPCATAEQIAEFEERNQVVLPEDLREYFLRFNGTNGDGDEQLFAFWQLDKLKSLSDCKSNLAQMDRYFLFADYMISCWEFAVYLGDGPAIQNRVIIPDFAGRPIIASNFSDFIELYLQDQLPL